MSENWTEERRRAWGDSHYESGGLTNFETLLRVGRTPRETTLERIKGIKERLATLDGRLNTDESN